MDLKTLWEERSGSPVFKERDTVYRLHQGYYESRQPGQEAPQLSYRPYLLDAVDVGTGEDTKFLVNHVRRVVNHFASLFAHPPELSSVPFDGEEKSVKLAAAMTRTLQAVAFRSKIGMLQPRQGHWLSLRGDCVYGVEYEEREEQEPGVYWRGFDPAWCYPTLSEQDPGGVDDMLVTYQIHPRWVEKHYGVTVSGQSLARVFLYWDSERMEVQVEEQSVPEKSREHQLGFVPFRWCFGSPAGLMGQADVREIPKLQDLFNENLLLAIDSIRKTVDPAYYGKGLKKDITPEPGVAISIPVDAEIGEFPSGGNPQMILGVMSSLESFIESLAGISPISMTGQASGSIVTGSAVRHQVEAVEARAETRKAQLEECYAQLGAMTLRTIEKKFSGKELVLRAKENARLTLDGKEVSGWYECEAEYGGFMALSPTERVRVSLEGLGRLWDQTYGIKLADLPGVNPGDMTRRLDAYQLNQAKLAAMAQAQAQEIAGGGQQPGPGGPQRPQRPQPPNLDKLTQVLRGSQNGR